MRTLLGSILISLALAGASHAGTPLDPTGELSGFVPPNKYFAKCERWVNKRARIATMCVMQCHKKAVASAYRNLVFDEEGCEDVCRTKYEEQVARLKPGTCPPCLDLPARNAQYAFYENLAEQMAGVYYCDPGGAPIGSDDSGYVPTLVNVLNCEQRIGLNAMKLVKCIKDKCHRKLADSLFSRTGTFNEPDCSETDPVNSCLARFETDNLSLVDCPSCIDATSEQRQVFDQIEAQLDSLNGQIYCASAGGAFVD
ncbi:MAG: hypothetical protein U0807_03405 [Candidatus Binatia bacterium]